MAAGTVISSRTTPCYSSSVLARIASLGCEKVATLRYREYEYIDYRAHSHGLIISLEQVQETPSQLTALYPESLSHSELNDTN